MTSDPLVEFNLGFDGRMFLSRDEWATYRRRKPVRYIRRNHGAECAVCGSPASPDNPFEHAHQIGFKIGVIYLGLTPDYVDSKDNIITAHRRGCNQAAELDLRGAMRRLQALGVAALPGYLPETVLSVWHDVGVSE